MTEKIEQDCKTAQRKKLDRRIDALGWGAFFIWTGIAVNGKIKFFRPTLDILFYQTYLINQIIKH